MRRVIDYESEYVETTINDVFDELVTLRKPHDKGEILDEFILSGFCYLLENSIGACNPDIAKAVRRIAFRRVLE